MSRYSEAIEQASDLSRWINSTTGDYYTRMFVKADRIAEQDGVRYAEESVRAYKSMINASCAGEVYYWNEQMCTLLESVAPSLPDWKLEESVLPAPFGYTWFRKPLTRTITPFRTSFNGKQRFEDKQEPSVAIGWATVSLSGTMVLAVFDIIRDGFGLRYGGTPTTVAVWEFGTTLSDAWVNYDQKFRSTLLSEDDQHPAWEERFLELLRYFSSSILLMNQRVLVSRREKPDRLARKRVARTRDINVMYLRRAARVDKPEEPAADIDWQYRWWVRSHWRNQWYPSLNQHRPILIGPYLKGPEDRPLKLPGERVWAMVR